MPPHSYTKKYKKRQFIKTSHAVARITKVQIFNSVLGLLKYLERTKDQFPKGAGREYKERISHIVLYELIPFLKDAYESKGDQKRRLDALKSFKNSLDILSYVLKLCSDFHWISVTHMAKISLMIDDIETQCNSWIKRTKASGSESEDLLVDGECPK